MAKIVKIGSSENKDKRLLQLTNNLNTLKASLANMIEQYENEGAEEKKMDTMTEALDALEDAYDALNDILLEER
ncbi:hypothetical protein [Blautia massiliensis (ex Durand et al. 2017)]|uniref:hypothetical protein n=1 Tax=Blautia massiliensis (ex Durand et al. 2017) TaxID=1737424 RepID=UPI00241D0EE2|nr:hypothetical protein [Blautia massiliensis (ex Durand et al. 2017)]MBN2954955.1 hypothetical protein [Blautia massiliensis (ex Durand et al. 2017)]